MSEPAPPHPEPAFTVAVCTHNRAPLLERALAALGRVTRPAGDFEILVVDNASSDDTQALVRRLGAENRRLRYVLEPRLGLSHARNRAFREARGEYVAYTDDDALVPEAWLRVAEEVVERHRPALFGGPYEPYFEEEPPAWFDPAYGSYEPSTTAGVLAHGQYIPGANLFVRRDVLEQVAGFDAAYGMSGDRIGFGEEVELLERVRERYGPASVRYEPALRVRHRVDPRKLHLTHFARVRFANGRDLGRRTATGRESVAWLLARAGWNAARLAGLGLTLAASAPRRRSSSVPQAVQRALPCIWNLGHIYGCAVARFGGDR